MTPLAGTWFDEIAQVYAACRSVGLPDPRRVDELEIWEIAAILGHNDATADDQSAIGQRPIAEGPNVFNARRMMAEQRARAAGREMTDDDLPPQAEVLDLIRRGKAG